MPTTSKPYNASHFVIVPMAAWGHAKPACQLALRLVEYNESVTVTLFTSTSLLSQVKSEMTAHLTDTATNASSRVRVLTSFDSSERDVFKLIGPFIESYPLAYKTLLEEKPITCATTRAVYNAVPAPTAAIIDFFMAPLVHITKGLNGTSVPVFICSTGAPQNMLRIWAPESYGGQGGLFARVADEAKRTGEDEDVLGEMLFKQKTGTIVKIPGLPRMFDHELSPQEWSMPLPVFKLFKAIHTAFQTCDGMIISASSAIDQEAIQGVKTWLADSKKPVYSVGPLLPRTHWSSVRTEKDAPEIKNFLSHIVEKYGEQSLILVSFGTFFWPPVQEYIEEVITALIEKEAPFVLAKPSPFSTLSDALSNKIKSSGFGMCSSWVPQQYILSHPVTGWFLTHGGHGSVTEALGSGVPLIFWPIQADQPGIAANVSQNLRAAFELLEVRTGPGLQSIYRLNGRKPQGTRDAVGREIRDVIDASRGEIGRELRKNAQVIKAQLKGSWEDNGAAMKELQGFINDIARYK